MIIVLIKIQVNRFISGAIAAGKPVAGDDITDSFDFLHFAFQAKRVELVDIAPVETSVCIAATVMQFYKKSRAQSERGLSAYLTVISSFHPDRLARGAC